MYLQLAAPGERPGYTFVPFDESDLSKGKYVRNDVLQAATQYAGLSEDDMYMSGFFGKLWSGIKNVATGIVKTGVALVTGQSQQAPAAVSPAVNVTIPNPIAPPLAPTTDDGKIFGMDKKTALLVAGGGLALILLLKKK